MQTTAIYLDFLYVNHTWDLSVTCVSGICLVIIAFFAFCRCPPTLERFCKKYTIAFLLFWEIKSSRNTLCDKLTAKTHYNWQPAGEIPFEGAISNTKLQRSFLLLQYFWQCCSNVVRKLVKEHQQIWFLEASWLEIDISFSFCKVSRFHNQFFPFHYHVWFSHFLPNLWNSVIIISRGSNHLWLNFLSFLVFAI